MADQLLQSEHAYLRTHKEFPSVWCPGCGIGIVLGAIIRAISRQRLDKNDVAMISGIGCAGRIPAYVDFYTAHTTHGRALAFATGLKLARPRLHTVAVMGDGDALAIGGNHFIHAARRNLDLTAIVVNNGIYGMTGGQYSPTTPLGARATTAPYGHVERSFDMCELAAAAGAPFVARSTVYHALELERLIQRGMEKKGFAVIEAVSNCHVRFGRMNQMPTAVSMLEWMRDNSITVSAAATSGAEGKIVRGVLVDREAPEFLAEYGRLQHRAGHAADRA